MRSRSDQGDSSYGNRGRKGVLAQLLLAIAKTREENLFEAVNELALQKAKQKAKESAAISERIEKEIAAGDLQKATDWMKVRDGL
jgi:hypothetical protein